MLGQSLDQLWNLIVGWLNTEVDKPEVRALYDFDQLLAGVRPGDVILFEGGTRVSQVIKLVTLSPWTHAALFIGSLKSISDPQLRIRIREFFPGDEDEPLVIESLLGYGTIINPLSKYRHEHLRVCRPQHLNLRDRQRIVPFALEHLGMDYDVRQMMDLARLMFPYSILPRRWRSSLFEHNAGKPTHIVCSSMIARCFQYVDYPILPVVKTDQNDHIRLFKRNFRLFVPSDFDYSPYFSVVKYPDFRYVHQIAGQTSGVTELIEAEGGDKNAAIRSMTTRRLV